ncbi:MAG: hypothetical protein O2923_04465 [Verrucomicrobia bacterium]|nr:hypothetical protein [Verrucomicrobiota bacterium]MDA1086613.1 hypothetical protein [Verrucomicrobiota bacterium]
MKSRLTTPLILSCLLGLLSAVSARAGGGAGFSEDSIISAALLDRVELGLEFESGERKLLVGPAETVIETRQWSAYVLLEVFKGTEVYASVGESELKAAPLGDYADGETTFSAGLKLSALSIDLGDSNIGESQFLLSGTIEYSEHESDYLGGQLDWQELRAAVLGGFKISRRRQGKKHTTESYTTILYGGGVMSSVEGDAGAVESVDVTESEDVGFIAGIDGRWLDQVVLGANVVIFDEPMFRLSVGHRF